MVEAERNENLRFLESVADSYRHSLKKVFQIACLDLDFLARSGVLSFDVGDGIEIPTFAAFKPQIFVTTEGIDPYYGRDETEKNLSEVAAAYPNVRLIRQYRNTAADELIGMVKFGLITWFNVFPEYVTYGPVSNFFYKADKLLFPGGAAIMSIERHPENDSFGVQFYRGAYHALRDLKYEIKDILPETRSTGGLVMIGVKPI